MAQSRYVSVSFNSGIKQDIPASLLPAPFLTKASNLVVKETGRLESAPQFKQLSGAQIPSNAGKPLKLFTRNDTLFCITDKHILIYNKANNAWIDFTTQLSELRHCPQTQVHGV